MHYQLQQFGALLRRLELVGRNRIPQHSQSSSIWKGFFQYLDLLLRELGLTQKHAGDIAPWSPKTIHIAASDRIVIVCHEYDWDALARPQACNVVSEPRATSTSELA